MRRIFVLSVFTTMLLCGCSSEMEEVNASPEPMTRAVKATRVVWQAQPGSIDIKLGQVVTVTLDGQVIK